MTSPTIEYEDDDETITLSARVSELKDEDSHYIEFEFPPSTRFENAAALFQTLRDLTTAHFKGAFWMIKMSSRVTCSNMPVLADPTNLRVLMDIFQPIRDPAVEVYRTGTIRLYFAPSKAHYFRKKIHAKPVRASIDSSESSSTNGRSET